MHILKLKVGHPVALLGHHGPNPVDDAAEFHLSAVPDLGEPLRAGGGEFLDRAGIARERVRTDIEAGQLTLVFQHLILVPFREIRQRRTGQVRRHGALASRLAEDARLPALALTMHRSRALERLIQHRGQLGSARLRGIERADLDQAFQDALVDLAQIDTLAEIQERAEPAGLIPGRDDGLDRSLTDILDGGEAEADSVLHDRKVFLALVRIRREHTDAKVAAFREIADHLVGVPHLARQQRSEELGGKMRLEIRGLVGHQRVGR